MDAPPCPPARASRKGGLVSTTANRRNLHKTDCKSPCSFQHRVIGDPTTMSVFHHPTFCQGMTGPCLSGLWPVSSSARSTVNIWRTALPHHQHRAPSHWENWVSLLLHKGNYNIHELHTPHLRHKASSVGRNPRHQGEKSPSPSSSFRDCDFDHLLALTPGWVALSLLLGPNIEAFLKIIRVFNSWHRLGATSVFFFSLPCNQETGLSSLFLPL